MKLISAVPYYVAHLLVAILISGAGFFVAGVHGILAGPAFYAAREFVQWRQKGYFDWPGLLWPVVPLTALWALIGGLSG